MCRPWHDASIGCSNYKSLQHLKTPTFQWPPLSHTRVIWPAYKHAFLRDLCLLAHPSQPDTSAAIAFFVFGSVLQQELRFLSQVLLVSAATSTQFILIPLIG